MEAFKVIVVVKDGLVADVYTNLTNQLNVKAEVIDLDGNNQEAAYAALGEVKIDTEMRKI